jgi:CMP/dCMP kinase
MSIPVVITLARQLGSGGSFIAKLVAQRLGYAYIDRQILKLAAKELGVEEAILQERRERVQGFMEKLLNVFTLGAPDGTYTPPPLWISDAELIEIERRLISELATQGPSVVLGHGAFHLLRGRARLLNVFVHAPIPFRAQRVMTIYHAQSRQEAVRMIEQSDQERRRYVRAFANLDWFDSRNYHLSIDTSVVDFASAVEIIASLAEQTPGENEDWYWVNEPV